MSTIRFQFAIDQPDNKSSIPPLQHNSRILHMESLTDQLSKAVISVFETDSTPATAAQTKLVQSAFSELHVLLRDALLKTISTTVYSDLQQRWDALRQSHIAALRQEILRRQLQASSAKSKKPSPPVASKPDGQKASSQDCQKCDLKRQTIESLRDEVEQLNAKIEHYKMREAAELVAAGSLSEAENIYRGLADIRRIELIRKQNTRKGVATSERAGLRIKAELASVLATQKSFREAEDLARHIFERQKKLSMDQKETWGAQRQLCDILRLQPSRDKRIDAEMLYREVWNRYDGTSKLGAGETSSWILENGRNLAMVLHEGGDNRAAVAQLRKVLWASSPTNKEAQASALQSLKWVWSLKQTTEAAKIIQDHFFSTPDPWTSEMLVPTTEVARALTRQGENAIAEPIWKRILAGERQKRTGPKGPEALDAAWHLALAQYNLRTYDAAKRTLNDLLQARRGESVKTDNMIAIHALLAATCHKIPDGPMAEKYAAHVWNERGNEDVLGLGAAYCAGVILVRAAFSSASASVRGGGRQKFTLMLAKKKEDIAAGRCKGKQILDTKTAWTELAAHALRAAKSRGRESSKLEKDIMKFVNTL